MTVPAAELVELSKRLESEGKHQQSFDVLVRLYDVAPIEPVACGIVAAMCRLSIRDDALINRLFANHPDCSVVLGGIAEMALQDGDYQTGFGMCYHRWSASTVRPESEGLPQWDGGQLNGKALLVAGEQGLGEEILFSSMFHGLPPAVISCDTRLIPLFSRSFSQHKFAPKGMLHAYASDCVAIQAMDVGKYVKPTATPWLVAESDMTTDIREAIGGQPTVGLSWKSARQKLGDSKSIPIADLLPIFTAGRTVFDLQYGDHSADLAYIRQQGHDMLAVEGLDTTTNIDGLAALISALDVVVTCSNTTAHLAGALGKRTILLLPGAKFVLWYWGRESNRTPWYPSVEIMRGPPRQSWRDIAEQARTAILVSG